MESLDWFATKSQGAALLAHFWQQVSIFSFIIMIITCLRSVRRQKRAAEFQLADGWVAEGSLKPKHVATRLFGCVQRQRSNITRTAVPPALNELLNR
jgi:hypothetical protein